MQFVTDNDSRFWIRPVMIEGYPIPTDGIVRRLLGAQNRHPYRSTHLHTLEAAERLRPDPLAYRGQLIGRDRGAGLAFPSGALGSERTTRCSMVPSRLNLFRNAAVGRPSQTGLPGLGADE